MKKVRALLARLGGLFRKGQHESEMDEEMRGHLEALTERNRAVGMSAEEARQAARRKFGGVEQAKEGSRDARRPSAIEDLLQDMRYALRSLRKTPAFTAVVVLILGLGIGVNTAMFSYINVLLLGGGRTPNLAEPERMVIVRNLAQGGTSDNLPYGAYLGLRDAQALAGLSAIQQNNGTRSLLRHGQTEGGSVQVLGVSGNFFSVLGIPAALGRTFTADDDSREAPQAVAVLSHGFWLRQFGGEASVIGSTVHIDKMAVQVIGVAPRNFTGPDPARQPVDLWLPMEAVGLLDPNIGAQLRAPRGGSIFFLMGRLRGGVTREAASTELNFLFQRWMVAAGYSEANRSARGQVDLAPGGQGRPDTSRAGKVTQALVLLGIVAMVLVLACANVASLILARLTARRREFAVRAAIGASRGRLIRQLLTESMLLAGAGCGLGLLFPIVANDVVRKFSIAPIPDLTPSGPVLLLALAVAVGTGMLLGILPAIQFSRVNLNVALHVNSGRASSKQRLNKALVVLQLTVSVCLLIGTGLFVRTLQNLQNVDLGFRRDNLLVAVLSFDRSYDLNRQVNLAKAAMEEVAGVPGVVGVSLSGGGTWTTGKIIKAPLQVEGYAAQQTEDMTASVILGGPRVVETMAVPLIAGRDFATQDVFGSIGNGAALGAALVNEAMARRFFGNSDPLGRVFSVSGRRFEIVGIVKTTKYAGLRADAGVQVFLPYYYGGPQESLGIVVRTENASSAVAAAISAAIARIDGKVPIHRVAPIEEAVERSVSFERSIAQLAGGFSIFATLLACLGLYGLLSYNVSQRTREIGVRMALGAHGQDVRALILKEGLMLVLAGCAIGSAAALVLARGVRQSLYGITAADPFTFVVTVLTLCAVALVACWLPARRATQVNPMVALRAE